MATYRMMTDYEEARARCVRRFGEDSAEVRALDADEMRASSAAYWEARARTMSDLALYANARTFPNNRGGQMTAIRTEIARRQAATS